MDFNKLPLEICRLPMEHRTSRSRPGAEPGQDHAISTTARDGYILTAKRHTASRHPLVPDTQGNYVPLS